MRKDFCALPWVHLFVETNGNVRPCCRTEWNRPIGNVHDQSLDSIWKSSKMVDVRKKLISGQIPDECRRCLVDRGDITFKWRKMIYDSFSGELDFNNLTPELRDVKSLDVRMSNLCNMKCRMCNPVSSSLWAQELGIDPFVKELPKKEYDVVKSLLGQVEYIYFAGGEPLIMRQHYEILEDLIRMKRKPRISYNTNMTRLKYGNWDVMEMWREFDSVHVGMSIDDIGNRAGLLRHSNVPWDAIERNVDLVTSESHITTSMHITVTVYNALSLVSLVNWGLSKGIRDFQIDRIYYPDYYRVSLLHQKYHEEYIRNVRKVESMTGRSMRHLEMALYEEVTDEQIDKFRRNVMILDRRRGENTVNVFPHLRETLHDGS